LSQRLIRTFLIVSVIVFILSLALPLLIPTPPVLMIAKHTLVAMHIIGAVANVSTLVQSSQRSD